MNVVNNFNQVFIRKKYHIFKRKSKILEYKKATGFHQTVINWRPIRRSTELTCLVFWVKYNKRVFLRHFYIIRGQK